MGWWRLVLASALFLVGTDACSCAFGRSLCDQFDSAGIVLRATVSARSEGADINDDVIYDIKATEVFKGEPGGEYDVDMSFDLTTGGNSALCGIYLEVGEEYLIDLYRNEFDGSDRLQAVGSCGMVRRWSMVTEEDQELLRGGCESYDPCEGVCGEFQECLFYTRGVSEDYYCADTCAKGRCQVGETCSLELDGEAGCDHNGPCPPVATCTPPVTLPPEPAPDCSGRCGEYQECLSTPMGKYRVNYCADTCDNPSQCGEGEVCSLGEPPCEGAAYKCWPRAICSAP